MHLFIICILSPGTVATTKTTETPAVETTTTAEEPSAISSKYFLLNMFGRPFVKRFAQMLSVRCLSCLSVCLSVCDVRALWPNCFTDQEYKMKLGMQVGLGPVHIVLGGDPAPPPLKGHSPPIFGPYLLRPNGCMDQDVTWYGGRPRPRRLCVRWGQTHRTDRQDNGSIA